MRHYTKDEMRAALALIEHLAERYPKCFALYEQRRRPLKIGIDVDLLKAGVAPQVLRLALTLYCINVGYLRAVMRRGERVGLDGEPAGTVTERAVAHAAHQLERRAARRERQVSASTATPAPVPTPTAPPPKRGLTLSDLKEAGRLRKQRALEQQNNTGAEA